MKAFNIFQYRLAGKPANKPIAFYMREYGEYSQPVLKYRECTVMQSHSAYDFIIDGVIVTMRAGCSNAKKLIDEILDGGDYFTHFRPNEALNDGLSVLHDRGVI